jgi:uncharacterized membrane-anchored protein YhcB (DUF1043 family)
MSKSTVFVIGALAFCLGIIVGLLVISSDTETFKKEKIQAETAAKEAIKIADDSKKYALQKEIILKAELDKIKYDKDQLAGEVNKLRSELVEAKKVIKIAQNKLGSNENEIRERQETETAKMSTPMEFPYKNVNFKKWSNTPELELYEAIGEITNNSYKDYVTVFFTLSMYDKSNNLIDTSLIQIHNLGKGQTKSFSIGIDVVPKLIASYKIDFNVGYDF